MKLATVYLKDQGRTSAALVNEIKDDHADINLLPYDNVRLLLEDPTPSLQAKPGSQRNIDLTAFCAPIPDPAKIICVGLNYTRHIAEMGLSEPAVPTFFIKFADALAAPFADLNIPTYAQSECDYEGELAIIIGKEVYQASEDEAASAIAGYAIMNDFSMRDYQNRTLQYHKGKSFYKCSGFGPWVTTKDEWDLEQGSMLATYVNDERRQFDKVDDVIFKPAYLVSYASQLYPLRPGDVLVAGTPEGVAAGKNDHPFLADGDTISISIEGLGEIKNRIIFDK